MRRILLIAPNWIGDAVMTQPLLALINASEPDNQIDVLATPWVAPIYRACPEVHTIIEADLQHGKLQWSLRRSIAKAIAQCHYDAAYVLPNSFKSALIPWLAGIPLRIGYRGEMRSRLLNQIKPNPSKIHPLPMVERYADLFSGPLADLDKTALIPKLTVTAAAQEQANTKLRTAGIKTDNLYILCPGAEYGPSKRWPAMHFAALAQTLLEHNPSACVLLLGSASDRVLGEQILQNGVPSKRIFNWCGETSLDEAIALIGVCSHLVSNDSGLMHIGAALCVDQVALFGSSDPNHTPPISPRARIISLHLACSPCHKRVCPLGHLNCLNQISPEQVFAALSP